TRPAGIRTRPGPAGATTAPTGGRACASRPGGSPRCRRRAAGCPRARSPAPWTAAARVRAGRGTAIARNRRARSGRRGSAGSPRGRGTRATAPRRSAPPADRCWPCRPRSRARCGPSPGPALGATDLDPEKSVNLSLGFTSRIGERFDLSFDLFQIRIDDRIALSEAITGQALTDFVDANFDVARIQSAQFFVNAADTRTRGAELVGNWRDQLAGGHLLLTGTWSYAKTELENVVATPAQLAALDPGYILFGVEESNTITDARSEERRVGKEWR